jgi:MOSC domain-containing protein YiiM
MTGTAPTTGTLVAVCVVHRLKPDGPDQALYAYSAAERQRWQAELGRPLPPGGFGENLAVDGIAVTDAVIGERRRITAPDGEWTGEWTEVQVTMPRVPCATFARHLAVAQWVRRFADRADTGAYLRVTRPGRLRAGDRITVIDRPGHGVTVRELYLASLGRTHLGSHPDPSRLRALRDDPGTATKAVDVVAEVLGRAGVPGPEGAR